MSGRRPERGLTLLEVTVTVSLMLLVVGALLGTMDVFTRADADMEERVDGAARVQVALGEFAHDLRAAGSLEAGTPSEELHASLRVPVSTTSGTVVLRWALDGDGELVRDAVHGEGSTPASRTVVTGVDLDRSGFRYFDAGGRELEPGVVVGDDLLRCAARVRLELAIVAQDGSPIGGVHMVDVAMRNREEGSGC